MGARRTQDHAESSDEVAASRPRRPRVPGEGRSFFSVPDAARMLGISEATLYRAVADGQFPAVRIRDRVIIPAKALEAMTDSAIQGVAASDVSGFANGAW